MCHYTTDYSHPISITQMPNTFSELVLGDTLPKPTDVRLLKVKYKAVMYFDLMLGPPMEPLKYGWLVCLASSSSHPIVAPSSIGRSTLPIAYQMQASQ